MTYTSLVGAADKIYKRSSKVLQLDVKVPQGYFGELTVVVRNPHYADDVPVDLCGIVVVSVGSNIPCINLASDLTYDLAINPKTLEDGSVINEAMSVKINEICYIHVDSKDQARTVRWPIYKALAKC